MKRRLLISTLSMLCVPAVAFAMSSTQYQINWDSVNSGGNDYSSSTNFRLRDTVGEMGTGLSASQNYQLSAGYRAGDEQEPFLALTVGTQENSTRTAWTAFSSAGKTATLTATSSFAIGDFIGVVENVGLSQLVAFGKITSISGADVTVDAWSGEPGSLSASPSGGNDFAYRVNGRAADLGTQVSTQAGTSLTVMDVLSNVGTGYTVSVQSDDDLRNAVSSTISNVADGAVSLGSEEYGGESVGTFATSTGSDFAFSSSTQRNVQESAAYGDHDRNGVIYKLTITASTPSGNYRQNVIYRLTAKY
jgi:hypothetical protein